jgi:alkylated DNA repair dioxygenase AlkB
MQFSLFDAQAPTPSSEKECLPYDGSAILIPDFLNPVESHQAFHYLASSIEWQQDTIAMYGKSIPIPRLNAWYADPEIHYSYSGIHLQVWPWTQELLALKAKIEAYSGHTFNSVLANQYRTGNDSVAWHADDEPELGHQPVIASLSLGSQRYFRFRHITNRTVIRLLLKPGSLLIMKGECQHAWEHEIPKTKSHTGARINLTFRKVYPKLKK